MHESLPCILLLGPTWGSPGAILGLSWGHIGAQACFQGYPETQCTFNSLSVKSAPLSYERACLFGGGVGNGSASAAGPASAPALAPTAASSRASIASKSMTLGGAGKCLQGLAADSASGRAGGGGRGPGRAAEVRQRLGGAVSPEPRPPSPPPTTPPPPIGSTERGNLCTGAASNKAADFHRFKGNLWNGPASGRQVNSTDCKAICGIRRIARQSVEWTYVGEGR